MSKSTLEQKSLYGTFFQGTNFSPYPKLTYSGILSCLSLIQNKNDIFTKYVKIYQSTYNNTIKSLTIKYPNLYWIGNKIIDQKFYELQILTDEYIVLDLTELYNKQFLVLVNQGFDNNLKTPLPRHIMIDTIDLTNTF